MIIQDENKLTTNEIGRFCKVNPMHEGKAFRLPYKDQGLLNRVRNVDLHQIKYGQLEYLLKAFKQAMSVTFFFNKASYITSLFQPDVAAYL